MRVLIVEDDSILAMALAEDVMRQGAQIVAIVSSAQEARAILREKPVDLVFLDHQLDDGSTGASVVDCEERNGALCVMCTGVPDALPETIRGRCIVLEKPYSRRAIDDIVAGARALTRPKMRQLIPTMRRPPSMSSPANAA